MKVSELELDLGTITMTCTTDEVAATLAALLREMRSVIPLLRPDERESLRQIMAHESGTQTVADVFPDFARESQGHKTLRRLRAAQFVRPAETGRWDPGERIEVKSFARLMWDHVGEDVIFAGMPTRRTTTAVEESMVGEQPAFVRPAALPTVEEPVADDVVDLLDVEAAKETRQPVAEDVVDLQDAEQVEPEDPAVATKSTSGFEDDNVLDPNDDELFAFAQEELRGKR